VELGEDAIIVASETTKDGSVILRAALDEAAAPETSADDSSVIPFASFEARYRERLMAKLRMEPSLDGTAAPSVRFDRTTLLGILRAHRMAEKLSSDLVESAALSAIDDMALALASALDKRMRTHPIDAELA